MIYLISLKMSEITPKTKATPQQLRAEITASNIIETTLYLTEVEKTSLDKISMLDVAKKSGYSVGAVYRYFKDKNDILNKLFGFYLGKIHRSCAEKLESFPDSGNCRQLAILMVDHYLEDLKHRNINNVLTLYKIFMQNVSRPEQVSSAVDVIITPLHNIMLNNKTGTFKTPNINEIKINLRGLAYMMRSTYLEQNPYGFTSEYREFLIENCTRLFGNIHH
jgi:AcrR family transcriptional regulator